MEVVSPIARSPDFHFNSTAFSPYTTATSSPTPIGNPSNYHYLYTSAPASPTRATAIYSQFTDWPYPTPNPRPRNDNGGDVFDFAFSPSRIHQSEITTADKLFEKGRIRPLEERGRNSLANSSRNGQRESRSLSPPRDEGPLAKNTTPSANPMKSGSSRKWPKLKDLLLFRNASEGRATGRGSQDPLRKYTLLSSVSLVNKKGAGEGKKTGGCGSGGETVRRGSGPVVSAHEKHYTANRAAAEEQKRKTPLPFPRQGLIGFIHFSPAIGGKNKGVVASSFSKGRF